MLKKFLVLAALFMMSGTPAALAANEKPAAPIIGTILEVEGTGSVTSAGKAIKAAVQTPVRLNDIVSTGPKSRIFILFVDETQFTLAENTKLTVNKYVYDPKNANNNKASFSVLDGAFEYVSGLLAKKPEPDVNINTSYGSIGVRGTRFWGGRIKDTNGVHVTDGRVRVRNDGGEVLVGKGQGTFVKDKKAKPTNAAPFPPELLQVITGSVFLMVGEKEMMGRILGQRGRNSQLIDMMLKDSPLQNIPQVPGGKIPGLPGGMKKLFGR